MENIKFDGGCTWWSINTESNKLFLERQRDYIFDKLHVKGYVYLNEIYEAFDAEWNPDNDNICYRTSGEGLGILIQPTEDNTYLIRIYG